MTRDKWDAYDPNLISEGLFAAANIFSSLKLIYIFTVNPHLGPLQITLGRMVMDIMKFGVIAVLVVFSYACGVNQLYWYYAEQRTEACNLCLETASHPNDCECDKTLAKYVAFSTVHIACVVLHLLSVSRDCVALIQCYKSFFSPCMSG